MGSRVVLDRATEVMDRLYARCQAGDDPGGLYYEAAETLADVAETLTACWEMIAALNARLDASDNPMSDKLDEVGRAR